MTIKLIVVGKTNKSFLIEGEEIYQKRLKHYMRFEEDIIPELKKVSALSKSQIKQKEGEEILKRLDNSDYIILLDDKGREYSSIQFSEKIEKLIMQSTKRVVFVVGGAYGFSDDIYLRSNEKLSLSKLTFSHQMVRLFFKEQLYRAFTILKGESYHHK